MIVSVIQHTQVHEHYLFIYLFIEIAFLTYIHALSLATINYCFYDTILTFLTYAYIDSLLRNSINFSNGNIISTLGALDVFQNLV